MLSMLVDDIVNLPFSPRLSRARQHNNWTRMQTKGLTRTPVPNLCAIPRYYIKYVRTLSLKYTWKGMCIAH